MTMVSASLISGGLFATLAADPANAARVEAAFIDADPDFLRDFSAQVGVAEAVLREQCGDQYPIQHLRSEADALRDLLAGRREADPATTCGQALRVFKALVEVDSPDFWGEVAKRINRFGTFGPRLFEKMRSRANLLANPLFALPDLREAFGKFVEEVLILRGYLEANSLLSPTDIAQNTILNALYNFILDPDNQSRKKEVDQALSFLIWGVCAEGFPNLDYVQKLSEVFKIRAAYLTRNRENRRLFFIVFARQQHAEPGDPAIKALLAPFARPLLGSM